MGGEALSEFDVFSVRGLYTSLGGGWTYLNAHAAAQIPERVSSAVARSFRLSTAITTPSASPSGELYAPSAGATEGAKFIQNARVALADLVGGSADAVVLGPSLPVLYSSLARAMRPMWKRGSNAVLSQTEHPFLTTPFVESGPEIRWAQPNLGTGEVPRDQYAELVDGSTRLVSISSGHEYLGSVAPVAKIVDEVRARSRAWVLVNVTPTVGSRFIDIDALGADILALDLTTLGGPQLSALIFRDAAMFKRLEQVFPGPLGPEILETPISPGLAGAVPALVDHYANLVNAAGGRRQALETSMRGLSRHMKGLADDLYLFLDSLPAVHIMGYSGEAGEGASRDRLPRLSFAVMGVPAETVHQRLLANNLLTTLTPPTPLLSDMGVDEVGGAVTVGLGPFNTTQDVNHLIRVVASLA